MTHTASAVSGTSVEITRFIVSLKWFLAIHRVPAQVLFATSKTELNI